MAPISKGLKIAIIVSCVVVTLFVAAGVGLWYAFGRDAFASVNAGMQFGLTTDQSGCVAEALRAETEATNTPGEAGQRIGKQMAGITFLAACFTKSKVTPGYCEQVPDTRADSAAIEGYITNRCPRVSDEKCRLVYSTVQALCHQEKRVTS